MYIFWEEKEKETTSSSLQTCFVVAHSSRDLMRIIFTTAYIQYKLIYAARILTYQKALDESGYHYTLQYEPAKTCKRKNRQRNNILWYNPPFSKNTSTNIGHKFLALVDKHFPKNHKLRKIFNRNTIKISYSCMNNTKQIIDNHNKRILTASIQADDTATAAGPAIIITSHATADKRT